MSAPATSTGLSPHYGLRWAFAVSLIVAGIRLLLIARWAGDAPYLDDWNGTGWLHIHAAESPIGIPWAWLIYPHAEHLLVTQRLYSLSIAAMNGGQWDVRAELMVAALAWGAFAAGLMIWGSRELRGGTIVVWAGCIILAEALPHAWENLLWAFQIQFLLLIGFSLLALKWLITSAPLSGRWFAGLVCGAAACLSQASGLLSLLTGTVVTAMMLFRQPELRRVRGVLAVIVLACLTLGAKLMLPVATSMENLHAHEPATWAQAAASLLAWPWSSHALAAIVLWLPAAIYGTWLLGRRNAWAPPDAFWLGLIAWLLAMVAASAWARGSMLILGPPPSRYGDILVLGVLVNALLVLRWTQSAASPTRLRIVVAACWIGFSVGGIGLYAAHLDKTGTPASTINRFSRHDFTATRSMQAEAVREYVRTRQPAVLEVQPPIYPVTSHLTELIDRLQSAHRWPATLAAAPSGELPCLSRMARNTTSWAWIAVVAGLFLATSASGLFGAFLPREITHERTAGKN